MDGMKAGQGSLEVVMEAMEPEFDEESHPWDEVQTILGLESKLPSQRLAYVVGEFRRLCEEVERLKAQNEELFHEREHLKGSVKQLEGVREKLLGAMLRTRAVLDGIGRSRWPLASRRHIVKTVREANKIPPGIVTGEPKVG